jgi:hypothetical protein
MGEDYLFTVCCPSCGTVIAKSFRGSRTFARCTKCSAELFYETKDNGTVIRFSKEPKTPPVVPAVPNL